jgi:4-amino-4-deoxy-L-arabinose transferase-like glycosyltransferase
MASLRLRARVGLAAAFSFLFFPAAGVGQTTAADRDVPSVRVGEGRSSVVEFDRDFQPLRRYLGFQRPRDVTPIDDGTYLIADEAAGEVLAIDVAGSVLWRKHFGPGVERARPRRGGGLVVTAVDKVLLTNPAREVVREFVVKGVRAASELPDGKLLVAFNQRQGWLAELAADGSVVTRSKPLKRVDEQGRWVAETAERTFLSIRSLDVGPDGTIFTSDFDGHMLRLVANDYQTVRSWQIAGLGHYFDTRIGPSGELVAVAPETNSVWVKWDGSTRLWTSPDLSRPLCANFTPRGTLLVGFERLAEQERLNATSQRTSPRIPTPFPATLGGAIFLGVAGALAVTLILRSRGSDRSGPRPDDPGESIPTSTTPPPPGAQRRDPLRQGTIAAAATALAASVWLAWPGSPRLAGTGKFWIACLVGGVALRVLNRLAGSDRTPSSFSPVEPGSRELAPDRRAWPLTLLAVASIGICLFVLRFRPDVQPLAVGAWAAAQVLLLAAAWDRPAPLDRQTSRRHEPRVLLVLVVLAAVASRFWDLGGQPDSVHWDHGTYGSAALHVLRGDWKPFFVLDPNNPSISRPWVSVCALLLGIFGPHYWVLRLTGALSGVLLVVGTYLLGTSIFNRRVGLFAAFLATINHVLLLYSREPYILDPAPLFLLALYFASRALKGGRRLHWCLAGTFVGWAMLTYWSSSTLAVVGGAILLGFVVAYPRALWRHRVGVIWLLLGALVVYLPMLLHMLSHTSLDERLTSMVIAFNPDGSLRREPDFWISQLRSAFSTILFNGDQSPWGVSTRQPICIGPEAWLFGTGLVYLLLAHRTTALLIIVPWIGIGFFLGNALFSDPRVVYHCLSAISPILLTSAVTIDRLLAPTDRWMSRWRRLVPRATVFALLVWLTWLHLGGVWRVVGRHARAADDRKVWHADFRTIVPRYIREHPSYRYYLVRTSTSLSCAEPSFIFFADDSDVSDVTGEVTAILPVPSDDAPGGAAFIVLPERSGEGKTIRSFYPDVRREELFSETTISSVMIYIVDPGSLRKRYRETTGERPGPSGY